MIRKIIQIDSEKCNGCGLCVTACHEGAIVLKDGKAFLQRDDYCDGLGDCLPACPTNAISFIEREALPYNEAAVLEKKAQSKSPMKGGCPGSMAKFINHAPKKVIESEVESTNYSELNQWPIQIKLVNPNAPYFNGANLLIAADCTAYAYGDFHKKFIKNKTTVIGCPKLDDVDYSDKLTTILANNDIKSITVVRMEVPCCGGIVNAVTTALKQCGKMIPWQVVTISINGDILD